MLNLVVIDGISMNDHIDTSGEKSLALGTSPLDAKLDGCGSGFTSQGVEVFSRIPKRDKGLRAGGGNVADVLLVAFELDVFGCDH